jgi:hypothetical protein
MTRNIEVMIPPLRFECHVMLETRRAEVLSHTPTGVWRHVGWHFDSGTAALRHRPGSWKTGER